MPTERKKIKNLLIAFILFVVLGSVSFWLIGNYLSDDYSFSGYSSGKKFEQSLEKRTLLIVIENNLNLSPDIQKEYEKRKNFVNTIFSFLFKVGKKELENKDLLEIIDLYGEEYMANRYKKQAGSYGKIIVLNNEEASYNNFKKTLLELDSKGEKIDILINLHGDSENIYFYKEPVSKEAIKNDQDFLEQKPLNIGYVYQTVCYGGKNLEIWPELGAQVAAGAKGENNYVILAPERFLREWVRGETYYDAVNSAFSFEVFVWRIVSRFFPSEILSVKKEDLVAGKMIFAGDKNYRLK